MYETGLVDFLPIWGVFLATVVLVLLAIEGGYRLGRSRRRYSAQEDRPPVGEIVAAVLGLLAFILAFTFGMTTSRFEVRRELVVEEANAIGTAYLRSKLLAEPHRTQIRSLLRAYVDVRLEAAQPDKLSASLRRSEELHTGLWAEATALGEKNPSSVVVGLFVVSLNEVIDLHAKRLTFGPRTRVPDLVWGVLYLVAITAMGLLGYHAGLTGSCRSPAVFGLVLAFAAVLTLNVDLDRPQEGILQVCQQALVDLQKSLTVPPP